MSCVREPSAPSRGVAGSYLNLSVVGPAALCGQPLVLAVLWAVNPDLAPGCQVGEEEHVGRAGVASLLLVESWPWSDAAKVIRECRRRMVLHPPSTSWRYLSSSAVTL